MKPAIEKATSNLGYFAHLAHKFSVFLTSSKTPHTDPNNNISLNRDDISRPAPLYVGFFEK